MQRLQRLAQHLGLQAGNTKIQWAITGSRYMSIPWVLLVQGIDIGDILYLQQKGLESFVEVGCCGWCLVAQLQHWTLLGVTFDSWTMRCCSGWWVTGLARVRIQIRLCILTCFNPFGYLWPISGDPNIWTLRRPTLRVSTGQYGSWLSAGFPRAFEQLLTSGGFAPREKFLPWRSMTCC